VEVISSESEKDSIENIEIEQAEEISKVEVLEEEEKLDKEEEQVVI